MHHGRSTLKLFLNTNSIGIQQILPLRCRKLQHSHLEDLRHQWKKKNNCRFMSTWRRISNECFQRAAELCGANDWDSFKRKRLISSGSWSASCFQIRIFPFSTLCDIFKMKVTKLRKLNVSFFMSKPDLWLNETWTLMCDASDVFE